MYFAALSLMFTADYGRANNVKSLIECGGMVTTLNTREKQAGRRM